VHVRVGVLGQQRGMRLQLVVDHHLDRRHRPRSRPPAIVYEGDGELVPIREPTSDRHAVRWRHGDRRRIGRLAATAAAARRSLLGLGPLFPVLPHPAFIGASGLAGCIAAGLLAGALSAALTAAVYASEDLFARLPIHWMWWPALGGLVIGAGGMLFPQALGVGYDTIGALVQGDVPGRMLVGILVVKAVIWSVSLGSGTSGGVLAPLLMMGGALGGIEAWMLPDLGAGFWPLVSMGAILGGTMRSPLTGVIFALELTHDVNMLLPLLVAVSMAHAFTVLTLKRSILTEKIARHGHHIFREYSVFRSSSTLNPRLRANACASLPTMRW